MKMISLSYKHIVLPSNRLIVCHEHCNRFLKKPLTFPPLPVRVIHVPLVVDDRVERFRVPVHPMVQRVRIRMGTVPEVVLRPLDKVAVPGAYHLALEHPVDDRSEYVTVRITEQFPVVEVRGVRLDWTAFGVNLVKIKTTCELL